MVKKAMLVMFRGDIDCKIWLEAAAARAALVVAVAASTVLLPVQVFWPVKVQGKWSKPVAWSTSCKSWQRMCSAVAQAAVLEVWQHAAFIIKRECGQYHPMVYWLTVPRGSI